MKVKKSIKLNYSWEAVEAYYFDLLGVLFPITWSFSSASIFQEINIFIKGILQVFSVFY